jgi:hypothetical protein
MAEPTEIREALVIRPGDKLIVRVSQVTTRADVGRLVDNLAVRFPDTEVTVIAAEQLAAIRPEPPLLSVQLTSPVDVDAALAKSVRRLSLRRRRNA